MVVVISILLCWCRSIVKGTRDTVVSGANGGGCVGDDVDATVAGVEDDVVGDRIDTNNTEEDKAATHNPVSS